MHRIPIAAALSAAFTAPIALGADRLRSALTGDKEVPQLESAKFG